MSEGESGRPSRRERYSLVAMAATYGPGVFNDSLFRETAMLLLVGAGLKGKQGWVMFVFTLPYLIFASPAGWLADRFPKKRVIVGTKAMELAAMLLGAVGICTGNWPLIIAMVFTMGWQSCLFSPSLNGSIPELHRPERVTRANAKLKAVVTAAILGGISVSGLLLADKSPGWGGIEAGRWLVALLAVGASCVGLAASVFLPSRPAASPDARFPWSGPINTLRELVSIRRDRLLRTVVVANIFVWSVGSVIMQLMNILALDELRRDEAMAGYLIAMQVVGVAVGGLLGGWLAAGPRWYRILPVALSAMGVLMIAVALVPALSPGAMLPVLFALMGLVGIAAGMCVIPCEGFVQVRAEPARKGAVIASVNFAVFAGIALSGPAANLLTHRLLATQAFAVVGGAAVLVALWLVWALAKESAA